MPRSIIPQIDSNFINGLITEATALNFPEKACTETYNCVFHPKGNVYRRLGIDFEPGYKKRAVDRTGFAMQSYYWQNAAGLADKNFLVVQIGGVLYFYDTSQSALSAGMEVPVMDLGNFNVGDFALAEIKECEFVSAQGYLFGVNPYLEPFYIDYNPDTDVFTPHRISILIRDSKGIEDETGISYDLRPGTLSDSHKYNLFNQGWASNAASSAAGYADMVAWFHAAATGSQYPSNADVWWLFKNSSDNLDGSLIPKHLRGNSRAPRGFFILSAFNFDRAAASGIASIPLESSGTKRPRTLAFHAGRLFYAGVDSKGYSNTLYYSQILQKPEQAGYCYATNDPTNQYLYDALATDGGTVQVLDCGVILKLVSIQSSLLIFATNGVWAVTGNQGLSFTPTDFSIRKISSIPTISTSSFVDVDGYPVWWNNDGIYMVSSVNQMGAVGIESLTEKTIKTFYNDIPVANKAFANGTYNQLTKQVQWLYRSTPAADLTQSYEYDRVLTYNVQTKAFYPWSLPNKDVKVGQVFSLKASSTYLTDIPELDGNGDPIENVYGEPIVDRGEVTVTSAAVFKYLCFYPFASSSYMTIAEGYDTDYVDFKTYNGTGYDYDSWVVTGYRLPGQGLSKAQENYILVYCDDTDTSVCTLQNIREFATSQGSMLYGTKQTVEFEPQPRKYRYRKYKLRGTGRSVQLKFASVPGKGFNLSGWARFESANKVP